MNDEKARAEQHESRHNVDDIQDLQHEARHDREESQHHAHHDEQETRADFEEAAAIVTRDDVRGLLDSVGDLEQAIRDLNTKMDRQWEDQHKKRKRLAVWLVIYTLVAAYAVGAMVDEHVRNCMIFGSVQSERTKMICDVTMPLHDHPIGGIKEDRLEEMADLTIRLLQERQAELEQP